jgi:hypothetical protein
MAASVLEHLVIFCMCTVAPAADAMACMVVAMHEHSEQLLL